jgi:hypothetical protein
MALIASTLLVEKPIQRIMGNDSTSTNTGVTYVEKGTVSIADNSTGLYLPTRLHAVDFVTITPMSAGGITAACYVTSFDPVLSSGTCQAGTSTTVMRLKDAEAYVNDTLIGCYIEVTHSDGTTETRKITTNTETGDYVTVTPALSKAATTTTTYKVLGIPVTCTDPGAGLGAIAYKIEGTL